MYMSPHAPATTLQVVGAIEAASDLLIIDGSRMARPKAKEMLLPDFKTHTVDSAPEGSRRLLQGLSDQIGFIPNLAATMAEAPALLEAFVTLQTIGHRTSLSPIERQVIAVAVATETGCTYCVAAHSTFALKSGAQVAVMDAVRARSPLGDPRLDALARFARAIVHREVDAGRRAEELLKAGLSQVQVLEALVAIAVPMLASSVFQLAPVTLDGAFQPQAWALTA
jgi:uncharacterized peroxidase-related enzyme